MESMPEFLTAQLGDLPDSAKNQATQWFRTLLTNLHLHTANPTTLHDPGDVGIRDRIISYLDQLMPDLWESTLGPEVEKGLNAILVKTQMNMQTQTQIGTVRP